MPYRKAWFAFGAFTPTYKQRTAMFVANKLFHKYSTKGYSDSYKQKYAELEKKQSGDFIIPGMPDPEKVKITS